MEGAYLTDPPSSLAYANVVNQHTWVAVILIAALKDLRVLAGYIQNAYLNAHTKENFYFRAGDKWKHNKGWIIIITGALYELKSSGLVWRNHLTDTIGKKLNLSNYWQTLPYAIGP